MTETVLVTGGTGFVAGWCITQLLERGYAVRATVRSLSKEPAVRAAVATKVDPGERLSFAVADLTADDGWDSAMAGCDYVLHVASPLGDGRGDADSLIDPARDGSIRVLRAATAAGVTRVVLTSSTAAATPPAPGRDEVADETVWTDLADRKINAYRRSKVIAERAAWEFMADNAGATTLTTILPVAIFGPVLSADNPGSSVEVIKRLLTGRPPGLPRFGFSIVDVRDLADLHIRAMTSPAAAGERFIAAGDFMWMSDMADTLRTALGDRAAKVPTRGLPDVLVRVLAWFVPSLRALTPLLGRKLTFSSAKAQRVLGFSPRPGATTVLDCAISLQPAVDAATTRYQ